MADLEEDFLAEGAQIVWVLEQDWTLQPGTAETCITVMQDLGSDKGWCVGDGQTEPVAGVWDDSPFSVDRGFDILVPRSTMTVEYVTNHGTPTGNENLTGADVLQALRDLKSELGLD